MEYNRYIAVKVCGNPQSNGGYMPLVLFNNANIILPDSPYAGVSDNSYFFIVRIEANQMVYRIAKNRVSSYKAGREGALQIAFSIPKGYKLANATPYDVLKDLLNTFLTRCMTCRNKDTQAYGYSSEQVDMTALDDIARQYEIVPGSSPWHTMNTKGAVGYIQLGEDKIEALLKDVQYAEFEQYSEIVVAESVNNPTPELANLQVPRKPKYKINVDGNVKGYQDDIEWTNTVNPYIAPDVARYYTVTPITFTIKELLDGSIVGGVTIDAANETIYVSTAGRATAKKENVYVAFKAKDKKWEEKAASMEATAVYCGDTRFSVNKEKDHGKQYFTLVGEQIASLDQYSHITVRTTSIPNLEIDPTPTFNYATKTLTWSFEVEEPEPVPVDVPPIDDTSTGTTENTNKLATDNSTFELLLKINADDEGEKLLKKNDFLIEHDPNKGKVWVMNTHTLYAVSQRNVSFKRETSNPSGSNKSKTSTPKGRGKGKKAGKGGSGNIQNNISDVYESATASSYIYSLSVPAPEGRVSTNFEIELILAGQKYKGKFTYYPQKDKDCKTLTVDRDLKKVPTKLMPNRWVCGIAGFVLCLVIWMVSALIEHSPFGKETIQTDSTVIVTTDTASNSSSISETSSIKKEEAQRTLIEFSNKLNKDDLTFEDVNNIYSKYNKNKDVFKNIDGNNCEKIEIYDKVVNLITAKDYYGIKTLVNQELGKKLNLIKNSHLYLFLRISYHDKNNKKFSPSKNNSEIENAHHQFESKEFKSFNDLEEISVTISPNNNASEGGGQEHR